MAAMWRSLGGTTPSTDLQRKRGGLPNLDELLWQNAATRSSFQSEGGYSSEDSGRKTSSEYCPSTPSQCESPSIEQFYFGMDNESPTLAIGNTLMKSIDGSIIHEHGKADVPTKAHPEMLASLTSFLDSQQDHYSAAINAMNLDAYDDYEDELCESDYEDYEDDFSDREYEYETIEIATVVSFSLPTSRPKLVEIAPPSLFRSHSKAESTSQHSGTSTVSQLYSQYSWNGEHSSDVSDHAEMVSEDEYHDSSEIQDIAEDKAQHPSNWPASPASPDLEDSDFRIVSSEREFGDFLTSSTPLSLRFSLENSFRQNVTSDDHQQSAESNTTSTSLQIPSRKSSKQQKRPSKQKLQKTPGLRRSGGRYSLFPLGGH